MFQTQVLQSFALPHVAQDSWNSYEPREVKRMIGGFGFETFSAYSQTLNVRESLIALLN